VTVGEELSGWRVMNFYPTDEKVIWMEVEKNGAYFSVGISARRSGGPTPPAQTELYDLTFGNVRPEGTTVPQEQMSAVVEMVANRVRKREKSGERPGGI